MHRIGTVAEKSSVEKELAELRDRLSKVEEWKLRRDEIETELNKVWVEGGDELPPPAYADVKDEADGVESSSSDMRESQEDDGVAV
jgi:ATP-binding cassette subfamily D (ALD) long-chain fatty acid import protein